jgi:serine phosphatase RsbU (regulator of sigma subunit)
MNHELDLEHALVNGGLLLIVVSLFMFLLIETRRRLTIDLLKSKKALLITNEALKEQKKIIEEKNRDITDSITYAKRIQTAILPLQEKLQKAFPQHFVLFKPKDIVSGDFYWFAEKDEKHILVAVDCTGHGVPGAFMSMIGDSILNNIVHDKEIHQPSLILNEMNQGVRLALQQDTTQNKDGMDLSMVVIDYKQQQLMFAGAKNPIWYFQNNEMYEIAGDKYGIGGGNALAGFSYKEHIIPLTDSQGAYLPTTFYLFSDGYQDQFGGTAGKKFMVGQLRRTIKSIASWDMATQKTTLEKTLEDWKSAYNEPQTDDVLVIGVHL